MWSRWKIVLACVLLLPLLSACVEDTKVRGCHGVLGLDGTWFGAMEDDAGSLFTLEWRICDDHIVRHRLSGSDFGITGYLLKEAHGVYRARFSDGSRARLFTDPGRRHGIMVSEFFDFAVLERHAPGLPRYRFRDIDGSWFGRQMRRHGGRLALTASEATCGSGLCSTLNADGFGMLMDLPLLERDFGLWWGDYTASSGSGIAGAMLSPDREFMGTYSCPAGYSDPWQCRFGVYRRD
ncbi:hypothetical protein [Thioalkalivibrio thiocyanodenitrificans]|uniref:hypothetical protein n=1 Tax=Thioalkalivibrio thiocyanodenitrificans TaxID=243063 RepID=UPI00037E2A54|nr:hypothetical protein [Thioalkalivibrio thiocyanodenitrificans]